MKLSDLNNLDPNNIGSWPLPVKLVLVLLLVAAIGGA
ncbi:MAG: pilus assembly protein PilO, partial [Gammaproteobacteria bacterium]|nr:pilus assembly protein PilO [Gammaproteobacteria bacterium]